MTQVARRAVKSDANTSANPQCLSTYYVSNSKAFMAAQTPLSATLKPLPPILGSIVCTPQSATVGEAICIEVYSPDGKAYDNTETTPISINGVLGSKQYLSWMQPGTKQIVVLAHRLGAKSESMTTTVQVTPADVPLPILRVSWSLESPTVAQFSIERSNPSFTRKIPEIGLSLMEPQLRRPMPPASITPVNADLLNVTVTHRNHAAEVANYPVFAVGGESSPIYIFEFSDGGSLGQIHASCSHDYGPSLDPNRQYCVFHVAATIQDPGKAPVTLRRSVTVHNAYNLMKRRGVLQPPVTDTDLNLKFSKGFWRASLTIRNPEPFDMVLTRQYIESVYDDDVPRPKKNSPEQKQENINLFAFGERFLTAAGEWVNIVLKAKLETKVDVAIPQNRLPKDAIASTIHFIGSAPNHLPVRVTAVFDIPEQVSQRFHLIPEAAALLREVGQSGVVANPKSIKRSELTSLTQAGVLNAEKLAELISSPVHVLSAQPPDPPAKEGGICDRWNLPDVVPDGMFCMPTSEKQFVRMRPRFMNAMRGDIILSPGNGSLISDVLANVDPPQAYSHSGIMTRNRDEITHSTGSVERLTNSDSGFVGAGGFRPDILKYGWPGVITQTVEQAVDGEKMPDPETGKPYTVAGFETLEAPQPWGKNKIATAMVVKPDPLSETPEIRATLHSIADFAAQQVGKSHYRFFCFTDPTIGLTEKAPAEAKWAAGTFPSVCSSFIWMAIRKSLDIRQSKAKMEGALEPEDIDAGAQIAADTPDGLYLYQADERLKSGLVLQADIYNLAAGAAGGLGFLIDIQDDLANQLLNSFANDWSDTEATESDRWKLTSDANAVSPQNFMFYDAPLYGYSEPLIYRSERFEEITVYKWKVVRETGKISGTVKFQGEYVDGAAVQITASQATHTNGQGYYNLDNVPIGDVIVEAQKVIDGVLMAAQVPAAVASNQNTHVDIELQPPAHFFRRIIITGDQRTTHYLLPATLPLQCRKTPILTAW
jgi:hypothetical protein